MVCCLFLALGTSSLAAFFQKCMQPNMIFEFYFNWLDAIALCKQQINFGIKSYSKSFILLAIVFIAMDSGLVLDCGFYTTVISLLLFLCFKDWCGYLQLLSTN